MPSSSSSTAFLVNTENSLGSETVSKISLMSGNAVESIEAKENGKCNYIKGQFNICWIKSKFNQIPNEVQYRTFFYIKGEVGINGVVNQQSSNLRLSGEDRDIGLIMKSKKQHSEGVQNDMSIDSDGHLTSTRMRDSSCNDRHSGKLYLMFHLIIFDITNDNTDIIRS